MAFQDTATVRFNLTSEEEKTADHIAGAIIFLVSLFGVCVNLCVVSYISTLPSMRNSFGILSRNQCFCNLISCGIFAFYYGPMVYFDIEVWKSKKVSKWFSYVQIMCYDVGNFTHLFASINRLLAIFFPLTVYKLFSSKTARMLNVLSYILAVVPDFFAYVVVDCQIVYEDLYWHYVVYPLTETCTLIVSFNDFGKSVVLITIILIMDLITFKRSRAIRRQMSLSLLSSSSKNKKLDEINFVTQACLQGLVFGAEMVAYFYVSGLVENRWMKFGFTQMAWVLVPALDGTIALVYNKEFRLWICVQKKHHQHAMSTVDGTHTFPFLRSISGNGISQTPSAWRTPIILPRNI